MLEDLHPKCVFCPETANNNPYLCLCFEAFCLTGGAVAGSRHVLSKQYGLEDTTQEAVCDKCLTVSIFCGLVGSFWAIFFSACLGVQQVFEMKDRGATVRQPCFYV
jgi:hypothetical protein